MGFVVVGNHDRICYCLSDNIIFIILDSENDSETKS